MGRIRWILALMGGGWSVVQVGDVSWNRCLLASLLIAELPLGGPDSCRLALGWDC